jgi:hypothetical protein
MLKETVTERVSDKLVLCRAIIIVIGRWGRPKMPVRLAHVLWVEKTEVLPIEVSTEGCSEFAGAESLAMHSGVQRSFVFDH